MRTNTKVLLAIIVLLTLLLGWSFVGDAAKLVRIAFAEEQTQIFEGMREKARDALNEDPPDVQSAVISLQYAYYYYPSGTKQAKGSKLDRVVERARDSCAREIISMLRVSTGEDLGDSPEPWIERYGQ
ncbi:MAG: hypothetical protein V3R99_00645 [Thermoguttaceae bacterium]